MASQSLAMGEAFGKGFQFGKRKISAMTNEEFNLLTAKQMHIETTAEIAAMIPNMKQSMDNFATLQPKIINDLLNYAEVIGKELIEFGTEKIQETAETAANFDYLRSFTDWIMGQGTANEQATLALLQKAGLTAEARISQDAKSKQLIESQLALKAQQEINKINNQLTLAKREAAIMKQKADAILNTNKQGPTVTPRPPAQAPNTYTVDKYGVITNKDTRSTEIRKIRAPRSIETQWKKLAQQRKIYDDLIKKIFRPSGMTSSQIAVLNGYKYNRNKAMLAQQNIQKKYSSSLW